MTSDDAREAEILAKIVRRHEWGSSRGVSHPGTQDIETLLQMLRAEKARSEGLRKALEEIKVLGFDAPSASARDLHDRVNALVNAALSASPEPTDFWLPIDRAVEEDGMRIWAYLFDSGIKLLGWMTPSRLAEEFGGEPDEYDGAWCEQHDRDNQWSPLFFLPYHALPEPPPREVSRETRRETTLSPRTEDTSES